MSNQSKPAVTARFSGYYALLILLACQAFLNPAPVIARGTVVKHVDMGEITKYQDSISPTDYESLVERAKQVENMIQSGPPKTLDAREYTQAIDNLKDEAKSKADQRRDELDRNTQQVNDEFSRLGTTFDSYSKDLSKNQKGEVDDKVNELLKRWNSGEERSVNKGLEECSEMLEQLKQIHNSIIDFSMSRKPKDMDDPANGAGNVKGPGQDRGAGNSPENIVLPGAEGSASVNAREPKSAPPDFFDYRYTPAMRYRSASEPADKTLLDLKKRIEGLKSIHIIGTFEYEALSKEWQSLNELNRRLKVTNGKTFAHDE